MANGIGRRFSPVGDEDNGQRRRQSGVQRAIQILSLRLPRGPQGPGAIAPQALLDPNTIRQALPALIAMQLRAADALPMVPTIPVDQRRAEGAQPAARSVAQPTGQALRPSRVPRPATPVPRQAPAPTFKFPQEPQDPITTETVEETLRRLRERIGRVPPEFPGGRLPGGTQIFI